MVDPAFPASLIDLPEPAPARSAWARVAVTTGGICGSDLHLFAHNTGPVAHLGLHGIVPLRPGPRDRRVGWSRQGRECPSSGGDAGGRRPVPPLPRPAASTRPCANCARGWTSSCLNLDSRDRQQRADPRVHPGAGRGMGRTGPGPRLDAAPAARRRPRPRRQPATSPSRSPATGCCAPRPATVTRCSWSGPASSGSPRWPPSRASSRAVRSRCWPATPTRPRGRRACGADHVVRTDADNAHFEELADLVGARVVGCKADVMLMGGFPYVVEAVGAPQIGHRGAARRRPPGHRPPPRGGRHQRGRPDADLVQGGGPGGLDRSHRRRGLRPRVWPAGPTAIRWTGPSTSWPPACCPTRWS